MSLRGLSVGCPKCGDNEQSFFLEKHESFECTDFAKGYGCGVCGHYWKARDSDMKDYPDEYKGSLSNNYKCFCEKERGE